jgi:putative ABC transport system ATP-binding protein
MPSPPLIAAENLARRVDGTVLVQGISFEVEAGDVFVIFGPSGAGKSTLLRLLNRLDEPTGGRVLLDGTDTRTLNPRELRRRVGWVPQQPTLVEGTVADNVAWGRRLRGACVDRADVERLLERLGLEGLADRAAGDVSGGEAQRVAIARTLYNDPEVVLLDEPASSLDAAAADRVETLLEEVREAFSLTLVLVTHDADRARRLGTRGLRLEDGHVARTGPIETVVSDG